MNTTDLQDLQPATLAVAPRPKGATVPAVDARCTVTAAPYATTPKGITGNGIVGSWLATSRLSMTVPAFHDRRPLCST